MKPRGVRFDVGTTSCFITGVGNLEVFEGISVYTLQVSLVSCQEACMVSGGNMVTRNRSLSQARTGLDVAWR